MPTVNLISETSWILGRCSDELKDRLGWSINSKLPSEIDYHLPYWRGLDRPRIALRVGFFTHGFDRAQRVSTQFDAAVCMNREMYNRLKGRIENITTIRPGIDAPARMPVFGVVGRTYRDNRKGQQLVKRVVEAGHEVISLGPGPWPCRSHSKDVDPPVTRRFFKAIDYLLVTSLDEGGPMPVLEAIAHNTPVIAPDVGWCWEFPVIQYERGSWQSLESVLQGLTVTPTWENWAESHRQFFNSLIEESV